MRIFVLLFVSILFFHSGKTQTYTGTGGLIPDDGTSVSFTIDVTGLIPAAIDTNFGLETVCINLTHTWDSDLNITLISPDGVQIMLTGSNGGDGDGYVNTCFTDTAIYSIVQGSAPFTGYFRPQENMGYFNNGQIGNGTWQLLILDTYPYADTGELFSWSITFGNQPAHPYIFKSSDIPIVVINTNGQQIIDDPKILADFGIIDNGTGIRNNMTDPFTYVGHIGIELRGSSSQSFPKKSYGFTTMDSLWTKIDTVLLGMPTENDWILNAHYSDKTLMRNVLTYRLWEMMGHYGARTKFCELVLNGQYRGVYVMMEKIKRDHNRVNISKMTPSSISGDALTGGYIIKIDKATGSGGDGWVSNYLPPESASGQTIFFQYDTPDPVDIVPLQKAYIQAYVDSFETSLAGPDFADTLTGFRKYASERSFTDYFIINELSKNVDGYRLSTFLHKNKNSNGGKLKIGPVWDYDIAWYNANYCEADYITGWAYQFPCTGDYWQIPFWWNRFLQDPLFADNLRCRWEELRSGSLSNAALYNFVDSIANYIDESKNRNFDVWPILGIWVWPNVQTPATYAGEIVNLKTWITDRTAWLDANIPGICLSGTDQNTIPEGSLTVFPNPGNGQFIVSSTTKIQELEVSDLIGKIILKNTAVSANNAEVDLSAFPAGYYFLHVVSQNRNWVTKLVVQ